jgi:hypothetical protein
MASARASADAASSTEPGDPGKVISKGALARRTGMCHVEAGSNYL